MIVANRIDAARAKSLIDAGEAVVLDVTSSLVWPVVGHTIPGAKRIAPEAIIRGIKLARPAPELLAQFGELPKDKEIVAYCT
ncbi:MAG: rhodanese-like domain-containing protein [Chloroflexi bacterium]|nr:MAG: rhodanese-like domain-containing protein [Chloroflexota bacterium]TMG41763.1 MAG: rhodanese-like domain-containing protein [Chloroflexota bacterium]